MDPEKKSLNFIFPTKYVIPKSLKFSHWPSKGTQPNANFPQIGAAHSMLEFLAKAWGGEHDAKVATRKNGGFRFHGPPNYLEDGLPGIGSVVIGSPPFISAMNGHLEGEQPILRGLTNHGY